MHKNQVGKKVGNNINKLAPILVAVLGALIGLPTLLFGLSGYIITISFLALVIAVILRNSKLVYSEETINNNKNN